MKKIVLIILFATFPAFSNAGQITEIQGTITRIDAAQENYGTYSDQNRGLALIVISGLSTTGCGNTGRVAINVNHQMYETVLALAMTAQATNRTVTVGYIDTCTVWPNAWDISYLYLHK